MKALGPFLLCLVTPVAATSAQVVSVKGGGGARPVRLTPTTPVAPPSFGPGVDYELAGEFVGDSEARDFDGDGWLDLAISSRGGEVSVCFGDVSGSLADKEDFWAVESLYDPGPGGIGSADFDGDGLLDLAVTVAGSYDGLGGYVRKCHVYLNDGDRRFNWSSTVFTHATFASDAAGGDFNEDGHADLAVVASSGFDVFLGNGDGTFGPAIPLQGSNPPTGFFIETHDMDGDGHLDLVAGFGSTFPGTRVFWGDGTGVFSSYLFTGPGFNFSVSDVDRDGLLDLAVAVKDKFPNYSGGLRVYYGRPGKTFEYGGSVGEAFTGPGRLVASDLNADGFVDVLARDSWGQRLFVGQHDGSLVERADGNSLAGAPGSPRGGDWNHDGRTDLVFPWEIIGETPRVRVYLNESP